MPEWLWAILIGGVVLGLVGAIWRGISNRLLAVELWQARHADVQTKLDSAEREILRLREWRHLKGDPYVGAVDALKQRVDRIEPKVFNGNH